MPELFDMIGGSETGAIIASSLVIKNEDPLTKDLQINANFAEKSTNWFKENVDILYHDNHMPVVLQFFITVFIVTFFSYAIYHWTDKNFYHEFFDQEVYDLQKVIRAEKQFSKSNTSNSTDDHKRQAKKQKLHDVYDQLSKRQESRANDDFCEEEIFGDTLFIDVGL
jgi:hypothetical protein